jgi:hypothetical protein
MNRGLKEKLTEADLAREVVAWLIDQQWEVYQEVQPERYSHVADIVAVQRGLVWVVECKLTMCLDVLAQAFNWREFAHYTSICVPRCADRNYNLVWRILKAHGIGWIKSGGGTTAETHPAMLNRRARAGELLRVLRPEHKTFAEAGTASGRRWTPFRATCEELRRLVDRQPGISLTDAVKRIANHYATPASARSNLKHWIGAGKVEGVVMAREGKHLLLYPRGGETAESRQQELLGA